MPLKYLMYFSAGIIWNISDKKYFAPLRILNLFMKSFVNPFIYIVFSDSLFNSFSTSTCFVLFEVTF